jgi:phage terminase large subunit-like protein
VVDGIIVAGPHVRASCKRHLKDLKSAHKRGLSWDREASDHVLGFFPDVLKLAGGQFEGQQFNLAPSQQFIVGSIFGWKRADGTRRFRRAYIEQGKGNGKSPLAAGIGLYCLTSDGESRAEVYAAASKRDQAMILFRDAIAMREQSPLLAELIHPSGGNPVWNLAVIPTGSFFRPISSEDGQSGPRPSCALCDEVHEHRDGRIVEMLERGFKWRRQPLLLMITNSGTDRNSVCWQEHQHAVKVATGQIEDDTTFSYVCALDEDDDPLDDPSCWIKANPLLGVTITEEYLEGVAKQAKAIPGKANGINRLHFCVWTDAEKSWMSRQALEAAIDDFDIAEHHGRDLFVGADLSAAQDLTCTAFVIETGTVTVERTDEDGTTTATEAPTFDAWIEAWTPLDTLAERALKDSAPYEVWVEQGFLRAPAGRVIRLDYPAAHLAEISTEFNIKRVAYDRYAFRKLEEECAEMNLDLPFIEHPQGGKKRGSMPSDEVALAKKQGLEPPQGLWMPGSLMELETLILEKRIRMRRNPVLISACMSAVTEEDPWGNRWLSKRRATNRIDAIVALAMAVGAAVQKPSGDPGALDKAILARGGFA